MNKEPVRRLRLSKFSLLLLECQLLHIIKGITDIHVIKNVEDQTKWKAVQKVRPLQISENDDKQILTMLSFSLKRSENASQRG